MNINVQFSTGKSNKGKEIGATGTQLFLGQIASEEYNADLRRTEAIKTYDKMRRSDAIVKASLLAMTLPLRAATWNIDAGSDDSKDQEIADFVTRALRIEVDKVSEWMWDDYLRQSLLCLPFGFMIMEKVYSSNGEITIEKLAPRLPKSIASTGWVVDENDDLVGIQQSTYKAGKFINPTIPREKTILYSTDREGNNYEGISLLRSAYAPWFYKNLVMKIIPMGIERWLLQTPMGTVPNDASDSQIDDYAEVLEALRAHEKNYVIKKEGQGFELVGGDIKGIRDAIAVVRYYDEQIVNNVLAMFMSLGQTAHGSRALGEEFTDIFFLSLESYANYIEQVNNSQLIPELVDLNFPNVVKYPRLVSSNLRAKNLALVSKTLSELSTGGFLLPDLALETHLREIWDLPAPEHKPKEALPPQIETPEEETEEELEIEKAELRLAENKGFWRKPTAYERHIDFKEIKKRWDRDITDFVKETTEIRQKQIKALLKSGKNILNSGDIERLKVLRVRFTTEFAGVMKKTWRGIYKFGREQLRAEYLKAKGGKLQDPLTPIESEKDVNSFYDQKAIILAIALSGKLKEAAMAEILRQKRKGTINLDKLRDALETLSDRDIKKTGYSTVGEAFNLGRKVEAEKHHNEMEKVIRSELMDENTCASCARHDGDEALPGTGTYDYITTPPYEDCSGQDMCRGIAVYVWKG